MLKNNCILQCHIYLALFLLNYCSGVKYSDYCEIDKQNTPCKYEGRLGLNCGPVDFTPLKDFERESILKKHNELRHAVADGKFVDKHLLRARDMNVLSWDKETEFFAREQVKQCAYTHDKIRKCLNNDTLGQNLASTYYLDHGIVYFEDVIMEWFNEMSHLDNTFRQTIQNYHFDSKTEHLTALLWASTQYIGCAKLYNLRKDVPRPHYAYDFTCNYRTAGNLEGFPIYTIGKSACAKPNSKYPALCGDIRSMAADIYVAPDKGEIYSCQHLVLIAALIVLYYSTKLWI